MDPDGTFIVAGDFNHCTLRSVLPKFYQNVSCTTRGHKTLDHVYSSVTDANKVTPIPHIGQSDHPSLFLLPKYIPVIKRMKPTTRIVKIWLECSTLQHQFRHTDSGVCQQVCGQSNHTQKNRNFPQSEALDEQRGSPPIQSKRCSLQVWRPGGLQLSQNQPEEGYLPG